MLHSHAVQELPVCIISEKLKPLIFRNQIFLFELLNNEIKNYMMPFRTLDSNNLSVVFHTLFRLIYSRIITGTPIQSKLKIQDNKTEPQDKI